MLVATISFCFLLESAYLMRLNLDKQVYFGGDEGFLRRLEAPQGGKRAGGVGGSRCHRRPQGESTTRRCTTPRSTKEYHKEGDLMMYYPKEENHNRGLAPKWSSTKG